MKRKTLLLAFLMLMGVSTFSQVCQLGTVSGVTQGSTVSVPITMTGFANEVTAFQWSISWDPAVLTYVNVTNWFPGVTGVGVYPQAAPYEHITTFVWGDMQQPINGTLCTVNFTYISSTGACTNVSWGTYPTDTLVADEYYQTYNVDWINGQVCGVASGIEDNGNNNASVVIYPTVAREMVNLKYTVPESGRITFGVYNMLGDEVSKVTRDCSADVPSTQEINVSDLNAGIYFVKYHIETANINTVKTEKITVTK
ncbi:MAG TPA: cohesin domain-containing protein [Bacteroidales bacterium]|nr:T9SS type A sorting domain-containing protein [Bacteroidales bacterium]OPZ97324.1 MAG: Cohesin domain protein [Bacteroidetes bacterium ADurb.Bin408]HNZ43669.1 cohesin domain-containing protein [Bacteroidales bacterium]HPB25128.1 cohesin domain-containing protein [Bacteroidales bacterium]HQP15551.1 cohesin domain-containing protein [Bacteroidales bacterium]